MFNKIPENTSKFYTLLALYTYIYMACSMANRTGSGFHVSDFLEILRIDKLT